MIRVCVLVQVRVFAKAEGLIEAHKMCVYKRQRNINICFMTKNKTQQQA